VTVFVLMLNDDNDGDDGVDYYIGVCAGAGAGGDLVVGGGVTPHGRRLLSL